MDKENDLKYRTAIANLRFAVIAPLYHDIFPDPSKAEYARNVAKHPLRMPDGTERYYSPKTILHWYDLYRTYGLEGLMPKTRGDKGAVRVLSDDAQQEIIRLREQFPRMKAPVIRDRLLSEDLIADSVSLSTIQRFIRRTITVTLPDDGSEGRERRAFEMELPNALWQADTAHFPPIIIDGRSTRVYLMVLLDDFSRLITGAELYLQDNARNFQCLLKNAVSTYGIPRKLLCDNGAPYANAQLTAICADIGIVHINAKPRDAAAKGKVERVIQTLRSRFLSGFEPASVSDLQAYRNLVAKWIRTYNATVHSATGAAPKDRFLQNSSNLRRPLSREWLDECFLNRTTRSVRKDSTFTLDGVLYDAPMQFAGQKVEVRYAPDLKGDVFIVLGPDRYPVRPTDKIANGRAKRRTSSAPAVNYALEVKKSDDE